MISKGVQTDSYGRQPSKFIRDLMIEGERELNKSLIMTLLNQLRRSLNIINYGVPPNKYTKEALGCDIDYFKEFIQSKMTSDMKWDNIDLYHIKPAHKFNLDDYEDVSDCEHYTNFQPLFKNKNLNETNWTEEDETFWCKNIIRNDTYREIYLSK